MAKQDILNRIYEQLAESGREISRENTNRIVQQIFVTISELEPEDKFRAADFGTFKHTIRQPRDGRDPKTGKKIKIGKRHTITFKIAKGFKESLQPKKKAAKKSSKKKATKKKKR